MFALVGLQAAVAKQATAATDLDNGRVQLVSEPRPIASFQLTDQTARPFGSADLIGRTSLVFFGFTNCRSVCPPTVAKMRQVARALVNERAPFSNVLISVDGDRDTPEAMSRFLEPFAPGFIGLTGRPDVVRQVATDFKAVFFKGMPTDTKGGYDVEHTPQVYLLDRAGRVRATFYNASVDAMVAAARTVMEEK